MNPLAVHIILYPEQDLYLAHCLEFDLVAQGATPDEAFQNLLDAIELQVTYTMESGDIKNLIQLAPSEFWQMWVTAKEYTPQPNGWTWPAVLSHADCSLVTG
jgi:predicted RNase H-like HicB family nuclease